MNFVDQDLGSQMAPERRESLRGHLPFGVSVGVLFDGPGCGIEPTKMVDRLEGLLYLFGVVCQGVWLRSWFYYGCWGV